VRADALGAGEQDAIDAGRQAAADVGLGNAWSTRPRVGISVSAGAGTCIDAGLVGVCGTPTHAVDVAAAVPPVDGVGVLPLVAAVVAATVCVAAPVAVTKQVAWACRRTYGPPKSARTVVALIARLAAYSSSTRTHRPGAALAAGPRSVAAATK
jgi:hypothetical protein